MPCARSSLAQSASSLAVQHQASGTRQTSKRMSGSWIRSKDSRPGRVREQRQGQKVLDMHCGILFHGTARLMLCSANQHFMLQSLYSPECRAFKSTPRVSCSRDETRYGTLSRSPYALSVYRRRDSYWLETSTSLPFLPTGLAPDCCLAMVGSAGSRPPSIHCLSAEHLQARTEDM